MELYDENGDRLYTYDEVKQRFQDEGADDSDVCFLEAAHEIGNVKLFAGVDARLGYFGDHPYQTDAQIQAALDSTPTSALDHVNQLIDLLESNTIDTEDENLIARLQHLNDLLSAVLVDEEPEVEASKDWDYISPAKAAMPEIKAGIAAGSVIPWKIGPDGQWYRRPQNIYGVSGFDPSED